MRTILFFLFFATITGITYCQMHFDDTLILTKALNIVKKPQQIVYVNSVKSLSRIPDHILDAINNQELLSKNSSYKESLWLTKSEKEYLIENFSKGAIWNSGLFPNSKLINEDSIWTFLRPARAEDNMIIPQAYVYIFTHPIFIRDRTICLVRMTALCGKECGKTRISFYKKMEKEWIEWIILESGEY